MSASRLATRPLLLRLVVIFGVSPTVDALFVPSRCAVPPRADFRSSRARRPVASEASPEASPGLLADAEIHEMSSAMASLGLQATRPKNLPQRGVFCTRELDLRSIKVIGYDMDYTLIDYKMVLMEERVYHYSKEFLRSKGFPVSGLQFAPDLVVRGLAIDRITGNILKVDRFGYVRRAMHGTRQLDASEIAAEYGSAPPVDLRNSRWVFLNTLFSVSEGCLFAQLVERLDSGEQRRP